LKQKKQNQLTYKDFHEALFEVFDEMEHEFVGTEEYEKAQLMLNAKLELNNDKELNDILNGNNIVYPSRRPKSGNTGV
jgi:hypothetical protein